MTAMAAADRLSAIEAIRAVKARYFRGVDTGDAELVRGILAEDCELDFRGCCTDPASGRDYLPAMNIVLRGRAAWSAGLQAAGIVGVHHGHHAEIEILDDDHARALWAMSDRLYMPAGAPFAMVAGHGYYHETYVRRDGAWLIRTLRLSRLRVEAL